MENKEKLQNIYNEIDKNGIVNILGTDYKILIKDKENDIRLLEGECDAYTDESTKEIVLENMLNSQDIMYVSNLEYMHNKVLRHEIIHGFMQECGLDESVHNEEVVEWISALTPKIFKTFIELGIIE